MANATTAMDDPKAVLSMVAFTRDPVLWATTLVGSIFGLAVPPEILGVGHGAIVGLLALLGGFFGKLLQIWLQFRQQRAKESEDQASRFERLLREERESHEKEQARNVARIERLEAQLDSSRHAGSTNSPSRSGMREGESPAGS